MSSADELLLNFSVACYLRKDTTVTLLVTLTACTSRTDACVYLGSHSPEKQTNSTQRMSDDLKRVENVRTRLLFC